ncbi:CIR protein PIR protein [Plasmodium vinckei petteri]|uniref:CIR protein PIR protein n=1 Tax=Plasmodium vinckei petteri TaxID=138298 RepID=A0A6V7T0B1_PLAVN|nr:CIR protein PIR protein [Plasmodium vinckei petteri]
MAKSDYSIEDLYKDINTIDGYFGVDGGNVVYSKEQINTYCRYMDSLGNCPNYLEMASSGVIYVLKKLKDNYDLEYDKLAEYAILWLRYKLNQKDPYFNTKLIDFYTNHIQTNKHYDEKIKGNGSLTYKEIIDTKKELMNIKEMTKFSYPFKILLFLYSEIKKNSLNCTKRSNYPKEFAKEFDILNKDYNNIEDSSYNKMLSRLSDDYNNLKNKYDNKDSCNFPDLPQLTPKKRLAQNPKATSSSSSISTTLIPALSIVSVIPVFLGISYKYSLFGVDKLFQRQYIRNKLKKLKKKMKLNI